MYEENYRGVKIIVDTDDGDTYSVCFRNAPGFFDATMQHACPLKGCVSSMEALRAGKRMVDECQWTVIDQLEEFTLSVRQQWNGYWGFSIRFKGSICSVPNYVTRDTAVAAGIIRRKEEIAAFNKKISK